MGSGSAVFFRGSEIRLYHFVGTETKICHAIGIKDQKFGYKNGISDEKPYLVTTLLWQQASFSIACREGAIESSYSTPHKVWLTNPMWSGVRGLTGDI